MSKALKRIVRKKKKKLAGGRGVWERDRKLLLYKKLSKQICPELIDFESMGDQLHSA